MSTTTAIETAGLTKDYGNFRALDDLTLTVNHGEVNGVGDVTADHHSITLSFQGRMSDLLSAAGQHHLTDINSQEADLDKIFLAYYRDEER